jgi:hypothetical protein
MGDLSPSPASRIEPLDPGERKDSGDARPGKPVKIQPVPRNAPAPSVDLEKDQEHQLDERA